MSNSIVEGGVIMTINNDELQERFTNVSYLRDLLHSIYSDVSDSYEVLSKHDGDISYSLSLNYLAMSHQSLLEFKRVYHQYGLEHYEIDPLIDDYEHYKLQLKEVITDKDTNTSWLTSALDKFTVTKKSVDEFLNEWIKNMMK